MQTLKIGFNLIALVFILCLKHKIFYLLFCPLHVDYCEIQKLKFKRVHEFRNQIIHKFNTHTKQFLIDLDGQPLYGVAHFEVE